MQCWLLFEHDHNDTLLSSGAPGFLLQCHEAKEMGLVTVPSLNHRVTVSVAENLQGSEFLEE